MPGVTPKPGESLESLVRRYKRTCEKTGINSKIRSNEFYEKPSAERKRCLAAAVKRSRKRVARENSVFLVKKKRKH
ncbi:MAG: 30S ribosomal protein S21 [Pseudomonadota bacterium]